ncbi:hypothetical protein fh0823_24320 [Francisella halioticida]|nr:hypothetical protein fh0823_24320 [Francisella halioticida]
MNLFSNNPSKAQDVQNNKYAIGDNNPRLMNELNRKFAALDKQQIKYLNTNQTRPQVSQKTSSSFNSLMKSTLGVQMTNSMSLTTAQKNKSDHQNSPSDSGYGAFANSQPTFTASTVATKLKQTNWTLAKGDFLHAVLNTAISSEIQGHVTATLVRPAYSYTGQNILLPIGTRLTGAYAMASDGNGEAATRIFIMWNRALTPKGKTVMINSAGADMLGVTGTQDDEVDRHFWLMFGSSFLISIIGAGTANISSGAPGGGQSSQQTYLSSVQQSFSSVANNILGKFTSIAPTLYANQGKLINIYLNKDVNMYKVYHAHS